MTDAQIKYMRDRFLTWELPHNLNPDGDISFKRSESATKYNHPWPVGTNFLDADQAEEMIRYMIQGLPQDEQVEQMRIQHQCDQELILANATETSRISVQNEQMRKALEAMPCSCTCLTHESDWPQSPHFKTICLFIKRLRQSGEPMVGPGEQPCQKKSCIRCAALAKARGEQA